MALSQEAYLQGIQDALTQSLCIRNFSSVKVERHNKPQVEVRENPNLLLPPISLKRSDQEKTLIEPSINSVRVSISLKKPREVDELLTDMFMRFLMLRADSFIILRRKPLEGYDISFLVVHSHLEELLLDQLVSFVLHFLQEIDREINEMKLSVNTRARVAATNFISNLVTS
jgi:actin related protein 2/3 complex subunit 4